MNHVRLVCRMPPPPPRSATGLRIMGVLPSIVDCEFFLVNEEEGTEQRIDGVVAASWSVKAGDHFATATLEVAGVEIDAVGVLDG